MQKMHEIWGKPVSFKSIIMLTEKKNKYLNGGIDKNEHMKEMFETHKHLFEYPELIKSSPVQKIEITDEDVIFTIRNAGKHIMVCCDKRDVYSIPLTYLNLSKISERDDDETRMILNIIKPKDVVFDIECATASSMANLREDKGTTMVECKVKKMDDFVSSLPSFTKLDFIKCDVEGAEKFVFEGGIETIKKYKPIIFSEMLRKWSKKFNYHPNDIINLFNSIDYECYIINKDKIEKLECVTEDTIQTMFLFFHKEKHKKVIKIFK